MNDIPPIMIAARPHGRAVRFFTLLLPLFRCVRRGLLAAVLCSATAIGQWNGYVSGSVGQDANPLCNYQRLPDRVIQTFLQAGYASAGPPHRIEGIYAGGLTLFRQFSERNYLDHSLKVRWALQLDPKIVTVQGSEGLPVIGAEADSSEGEEEDSVAAAEDEGSGEPAEDEELDPASVHVRHLLQLEGSIGARHDRSSFQAFDNHGASFSAEYLYRPADGVVVRSVNKLSVRSYPSVAELSNVADEFEAKIELHPSPELVLGCTAGAGVRSYLTTTYDTTKYEQAKTYVSTPGTGKLGGIVKKPSGKQVLIQPAARSTMQYVAGVNVAGTIAPVTTGIEIRYRYNPAPANRTVAQDAAGDLLTDDLYNEYFSHEGWEAAWRLEFPAGPVTVTIEAGGAQKRFDVPALLLSGDAAGGTRADLEGTASLQCALPLSVGNIAFDLGLLVQGVRNQSNDEYNDFSGAAISISLGYGF